MSQSILIDKPTDYGDDRTITVYIRLSARPLPDQLGHKDQQWIVEVIDALLARNQRPEPERSRRFG